MGRVFSRVWKKAKSGFGQADNHHKHCGNLTGDQLLVDTGSSSGKIPPALSCAQLKQLMVDALENAPDATNPETFHARFDHLERGIQISDVIYGIETEWKSCRPLRFNKRFWQWNYEIRTENADEEALTLIVAVDTVNRTFEVITRWTEDTSV